MDSISKIILNTITDFKNWFEVTKGIYRYVLSAGAAYEIQISLHYEDDDILNATASLYICGDWELDEFNHNKSYFERELLLDGISNKETVKDCLEAAYVDFKENMK